MATNNRKPGSGPVPKAIIVAAARIRAEHGGGGPCTRCNGEGYCDHKPKWIIAKGKKGEGKVCFRCHGDGIEPGASIPSPLSVRRTVVLALAKLVAAGDVVGIDRLRREHDGGMFWPVLADAFERAIEAAKAKRSTNVVANIAKARRVRTVDMVEHVSAHPLRAAAFAVLDKHHPNATPEEIADAMGGHATFDGQVEFDEFEF